MQRSRATPPEPNDGLHLVYYISLARISTSFLRAPPLDGQNKQALSEFSCPCVRTLLMLPLQHTMPLINGLRVFSKPEEPSEGAISARPS